MTEIPIRVDLNGNTKSKSDEKPEFIVNGKEIKSHAELSKKEYLKELLSPKNKYGLGSNRSSSRDFIRDSLSKTSNLSL